MSQKNVLKMQECGRWDEGPPEAYHMQIRVKKVKRHKASSLRWLLALKNGGQTILGEIIYCDIDLKEKELHLYLCNSLEVSKGDLLNLVISETGWCMEIKKHALS